MLYQLLPFLRVILCSLLILMRTSPSEATTLQFLGQQPFTAYVSRAATPGNEVYRFVAINLTDLSPRGISYTLFSGSPLFQIDTESGILTNLDYLPLKTFQLSVVADLNKHSSPAELMIHVLPEYEITPKFEHSSFTFATSEYTPVGMPFALIRAFSLDPLTTVKGYSIARGNTGNDLTINSTTGVLLVGRELDHDITPSYSLVVTYREKSGSEISVNVAVTVRDENDNAPEFSQLLYRATINEATALDSSVLVVSATDKDSGSNAAIDYRIEDEVDEFTLDVLSGQLSLTRDLDYEQQLMYIFIVVAEDRGAPALSSTAIVVVDVVNNSDECPLFDSKSYAAVFLPGTEVRKGMTLLTVRATDLDASTAVVYSIETSSNDHALDLDPHTGLITLNDNTSAPNVYILNISANDGTCMDLTTVEININANNQHSPQFEGPCTAEIEENALIASSNLRAVDNDNGVYGLIRYGFSEDIHPFMIDPTTGMISTTQILDHETVLFYLIGVTATDGGNKQAYCLLNITVVDINDNVPSFLEPNGYTRMLPLSSPPGTTVLQVLAEDLDSGANGDISYSLDDSANGLFEINSSSGTITTTSTLSVKEYTVIVRASDRGGTPLTSTVIVSVMVVNSSSLPSFNQSVYSITKCENLQYPQPVIQVHVESESIILYQLISGSQYYNNGDNVFSIDTTGLISVTSQGSIDYEKLPQGYFQFSVSAQNTDGVIVDVATIVIDILDQDDNGPIFRSPNIYANLSENMPANTLVTELAAVDPDSGINGEVTYIVSFGQEYVDVSSAGEIFSRAQFDAERMPPFIVHVVASNPNQVNVEDPCYQIQPQMSAAVVIRVSILDINDNPPTLLNTTTSFNIPEDALPGCVIHTFLASDPDSNDIGRLVYTITGGNEGIFFQINNNGVLSLLRVLNYEEQSNYTLTIQVSDGMHTNFASVEITITDVDDEAPVFTMSIYTSDIIENAPLGTSILQVSATDSDTDNILYSLTGPAVGRLAINHNGDITITGNVDREEFPNGIMSFLVVAKGGSLTTAQVNVTINDVNDYIPYFTNTAVGEVVENGDTGISVGTIVAVDLDSGANGTVTYRLVQGEEQGFQIDPNTGEITTHMQYDREMVSSYTLVVEAIDSGTEMQLSSTALVYVPIGDVNDNPPFFLYPYAFARVFEKSKIGTEVVRMPSTDLDNEANAIMMYTRESSFPQELKYDIDSATGVVTVTGELQYSIPNHRIFNLTFSLMDPSFTGSVSYAQLEVHLMDINDNKPVLTISMIRDSNLPENIPTGTTILELMATDKDTGSNGEIKFFIIDGDPKGDFQITNTGSLVTAHPLDYESTPTYELTFEACDMGKPPLCTTDSATLNIVDVNDVKPSFPGTPYKGSVKENSGPMASILQVSAIDSDFASSFEYTIVSGNTEERFFLNRSSGVLSSTTPLDREEQDTYTLVVIASDSAASRLTGTGTIVISVIDVNDNPSSNSMSQIQMVLLDGQLPAGPLVPIFFSDPDSTYTFINCVIVVSPTNYFSVDSTCMLSLVTENPPEGLYRLTIVGNDGKHSNVNSQIEISIVYLSLSDISFENIITISLAMSSVDYLNTAYSSFPADLAKVLGIDDDFLTIISIQKGYHDSEHTVDLTFTARNTDGSFLHPTYVLQVLYLQRETLGTNGYIQSALPTDACSSEPCINEANCKSIVTINNSTLSANSSDFALISPKVELSYECECVPGVSGEECSINYSDCYSNPCLYNAECRDSVNGFQCGCPPGSGGRDCSSTPDECSSNPCQNGATCVNIPGSHSCHCVPGYYGTECQYHYFRTATTCEPNLCQNGATCSPGRDSFTCLCPNGYSGQFCNQSLLLQGGCTGNPCYNGSTCSESPDGPVCTCSVGFTGRSCRWPLNNCEMEPCQNGGTCATGLYGSFQCYCPPPYTGQECEAFILGCESSPCENGGRCTDTSEGKYSCECTRGFYGVNCQYSVQPQNLCTEAPCVSGNCSFGRDTYTCTCINGHSGTSCENAFPLSSLCDSNPCLYGSTCELDGANYSCTCSPGYTGSNCEVNIDNCIPNPCMYGTCKDGINGFLCECDSEQITGNQCEVYCPDGHSGNFCETKSLLCSAHPSLCHNGGTCMERNYTFFCTCPPYYTGTVCELKKTCDMIQCRNGGTCLTLPGSGFGCQCQEGFDGPNCELVGISFTTETSYRAFPSLELRGQGTIKFEFSTLDSEGLLLYNTQLQAGGSHDYITVEVSRGQLVVGVSHGKEKASAAVTSSVVTVNDGQWHTVTVQTSGNRVSVLLDFCHELEESAQADAGCSSSAVTQGEHRFLDLGLPLWLGGIPFSPSASLPVSSQGIIACMRSMHINGQLLDLNSHVDEQGTQQGCPQLDSKCESGVCGTGQCLPTWSRFLCICPPLMTGEQCSEAAPSLTYTGTGYAHYMLSEEGIRQRRQSGQELRSTYHDTVSLSLRTAHNEGLFYHMQDETGTEFLYLQLSSGELELHLDLGSGPETVLTAGPPLNDSQLHNVSVARTGLAVTLKVDGYTLQHTLSFTTDLTLEIASSEIYTGGSPYLSSGFNGCLQDVRLDGFNLPTSGSNQFASVLLVGVEGAVVEGCSLSPCSPGLCGSGKCEEVGNGSYVCLCEDNRRSTSTCPQREERDYLLPYIVAGSVLGCLVFLSLVTLSAGGRWWWQRRKRHTYLVRMESMSASQELVKLFAASQALVISNEEGGGEADTVITNWTPLTSQPTSLTSQRSSASSVSGSGTHKAESSPTEEEKKEEEEEKEEEEKEGVDGDDVRSNSPVIRAYLQERVDTATAEVKTEDIDSVREFCEEGSESEHESLSSVISGLSDEEEYTLDMLRAAGPPLSSLVPILEHVLHEGESVRDSSSDILYTSQEQ